MDERLERLRQGNMVKTRKARKILAYIILAYIVVAVAFTTFRYQVENRNWELVLRDRLKTGAALLKHVMPAYYFDRAVSAQAITPEEHRELAIRLSQITWETGFRYLYALKEANGKFYFITCSMDRSDIGQGKIDPYWLEYTEAPKALYRAFKTRKVVFSKVTDRWGTFYSIFSPEYSPSGQYYIAGADLDYSDVKRHLGQIVFWTIIQSSVLLVLLLVVYFGIMSLQSHYIKRLQLSNAVNETAPVGVLRVQANGMIDYINLRFADLLSLPLSALEGRDINADLGFAKHDALVERIRVSLTRQLPWQGEFPCPTSDGKERWLQVIINHQAGSRGEKSVYNIFATDVTQQMLSRNALAHHNKAMQFLTKTLHMLLSNPDLTKILPDLLEYYGTSLNKTQVTILKRTHHGYHVSATWINPSLNSSVIPVKMFNKVHKTQKTDWEKQLEGGNFIQGEFYDFPISFITMARICMPGIVFASPIISQQQFWGFIVSLQSKREEEIDLSLEQMVLTTITENIGSAIKRHDTEEQLRKATDAKSNFLSSMSHEIRTPLNGVIGMISLMESTSLNPEQKEYLEVIRSSGKQLLSLINNILDISRIEAGKVVLRNDPINLSLCLQNAVSIVNYALKEKHLQFHLDLDPRLPVAVQGDETRLKQIIVNLLHNSIKFTDNGSVTLKVERYSKHKLQFIIRDTGIGMTPEQVKHVFDPFYQAGSATHKVQGSGLGLAITRQLISLMNGQISVDSESGKGSVFKFSLELPVWEEHPEFAEAEAAAEAAEQADKGKQPASELVLLTGNDLDDKVLTSFLQSMDLEVHPLQELEDLEPYLAKPASLVMVNLSKERLKQKKFLTALDQLCQTHKQVHWLMLGISRYRDLAPGSPYGEHLQVMPKPPDFEKLIKYLKSVRQTQRPMPAPASTPTLDNH